MEGTVKEEYNDQIEKNYVIKQDIAENERIAAGTTITIYVSSGIEKIQVPDLSNKTEAEAKKMITDSKLTYKTTIRTNDPSKANGVVVSQEPDSGASVDKGAEVTITVNEFNELKSATVTVNVKSLIGYEQQTDENGKKVPAEDVTLQVTVNDESIGTRTVKETSTKEEFTFQDRGIVDIKVYVDGDRKSTQSLDLNQKTSLKID